MNIRRSAIAACAGGALLVSSLLLADEPPKVQRNIVLKEDIAAAGHEGVMARVEIPPGATEGRHTHPAVHKVQDAIGEQPQRDWDMAALAAIGNVTERHLLRLFTDHAGASPMQCLQAIRLERARQSLEHGASVATAAEVSGFRSSLNLRRAWSKQWGGSPSDAHRAGNRSV